MHPVIVAIGPFQVAAYGLAMILAFVAGVWLARRQAPLDNLDVAAIFPLCLTLFIAGMLGAKVFVIFPELARGASLSEVLSLETLQAGGTIHGGVVFAVAALVLMTRKMALPFRATGDALAPGLALGQAVGRLGCFFGGCCFGSTCTYPWAVTFTDPLAATHGTPLGVAVHPVQIYTLVANLTVMSLLLLLRRRRPFHGSILAAYFVLEGLGRIVTETWRGDVLRGFWLGLPWLSTGRVTGLGFVVVGMALWALWGLHRRVAGESGPPAGAA